MYGFFFGGIRYQNILFTFLRLHVAKALFRHLPELLAEDPLVLLRYLGKRAGLMGWFPSISAAGLIAWDVHSLAALGANPSITIKC
jgi:hypothetical protein